MLNNISNEYTEWDATAVYRGNSITSDHVHYEWEALEKNQMGVWTSQWHSLGWDWLVYYEFAATGNKWSIISIY